MSFDYLVMRPADFSRLHPETEFTMDSVNRVYAAMDAAEGAIPVELADFTAEVLRITNWPSDGDEPTGWLAADPDVTPLAVYLCASWQTIPTSTADVLRLAAERGLLVYDPQESRVYDPTDGVPLHAWASDGRDAPFLSPSLLDSFMTMVVAESGWVIVERGGPDAETYAQSRRSEDGTFSLEHRDGDVRHHFQILTTDAALVERTLWQWATGDMAWRQAGKWKRIDLG